MPTVSMHKGAKRVQPMDGYRLLITFENDERKIFDVGPYLDTGIFRELIDPGLFNRVRVVFDSVQWPNGADLCPEALYDQGVAVSDSPASKAAGL
jgi:hypothetical protein